MPRTTFEPCPGARGWACQMNASIMVPMATVPARAATAICLKRSNCASVRSLTGTPYQVAAVRYIVEFVAAACTDFSAAITPSPAVKPSADWRFFWLCFGLGQTGVGVGDAGVECFLGPSRRLGIPVIGLVRASVSDRLALVEAVARRWWRADVCRVPFAL